MGKPCQPTISCNKVAIFGSKRYYKYREINITILVLKAKEINSKSNHQNKAIV
jgi:hypothetical protein